jgi:NCS1 family nucleobase:cation symporter-1
LTSSQTIAKRQASSLAEHVSHPHPLACALTLPQWTNLDLAPSPPQDRKWTQWTFLAFWTAHAANVGNWTSGSSLISLGLYPLDTWLAIAFAHVLITALIVANGRGPARYHIGFPVIARTTYGMWGSYMAVGMRAVVCIIWNGVNSY